MHEGLHSALGGIGCVSYIEYFASINGTMSAMCCNSLEQLRRSSLTAKLGNVATFPRTTLAFQPCFYSNEQFTGVNYLVRRNSRNELVAVAPLFL